MYLLIRARDQRRIEKRVLPGKGAASFSRKDKDHRFLGGTRCDPLILTNHSNILRPFIGGDSRLIWRKNDHIWRRKKCFSTTIKQRLTPPQSPQTNWSNFTTNFSPICCIIGICFPDIPFCSQPLRGCSPKRWTGRRWKSSPLRKSTLQINKRRTISMA